MYIVDNKDNVVNNIIIIKLTVFDSVLVTEEYKIIHKINNKLNRSEIVIFSFTAPYKPKRKIKSSVTYNTITYWKVSNLWDWKKGKHKRVLELVMI